MIRKLNKILSIFTTYENPFNICYNLFYKKKFPIKLQLKNKQTIVINNKSDIFFLAKNQAWKYCLINDEKIIISRNGITSIFKNWRGSEINEIFLENEYGYFDFRDKIVVDVGANIGDSTIYFAKNGARKVIALEPMNKNYDMAMENLKLNELQNQVILLMVGMANESKIKKIDQDIIGHSARPIEKENGKEVQFITLKQLVEQYDIKNGMLKLDCEDCEYDAILLSDVKILHGFTNIIIEFHRGFSSLKERLEKNGYTVKITNHKFGKDSDTGKKNETGLLYATLE